MWRSYQLDYGPARCLSWRNFTVLVYGIHPSIQSVKSGESPITYLQECLKFRKEQVQLYQPLDLPTNSAIFHKISNLDMAGKLASEHLVFILVKTNQFWSSKSSPQNINLKHVVEPKKLSITDVKSNQRVIL